MKKSLFAFALSTSLFAANAHAQTQTNQVYSQQQMSNQLNGNLQNWRNRRDLYRKYGLKRAPNESQADFGRRVMESGRATVKFQTRPFPLAQWMKTDWNGDAVTRRKNLAEWKTQSALWREEARKRGARFNDMAEMYALAVVTSYEAYTGKRVSNAGFKAQAREFTDFFNSLAFYQGYSAREKQGFYEYTMVRVSNALRQRRAGQIERAQENAGAFLNEWATGKLPGILETLAPYAA